MIFFELIFGEGVLADKYVPAASHDLLESVATLDEFVAMRIGGVGHKLFLVPHHVLDLFLFFFSPVIDLFELVENTVDDFVLGL